MPSPLGQSIRRREDAALLTGRGRYVEDLRVPGAACLAFVRSPYAKARLGRIDIEAARSAPGVIMVVTADDLRGLPGRLTVASVMDRDFGRVQVGLSVQAFAEAHLLEKPSVLPRRHTYAVYQDEYLVGLVSLRELGRIPMQRWSQTSIERAMLPIESAPAMEPGAPALGALHLILEEGVEHIAVMAEGRLLGLVTRNELARAQEHA